MSRSKSRAPHYGFANKARKIAQPLSRVAEPFSIISPGRFAKFGTALLFCCIRIQAQPSSGNIVLCRTPCITLVCALKPTQDWLISLASALVWEQHQRCGSILSFLLLQSQCSRAVPRTKWDSPRSLLVSLCFFEHATTNVRKTRLQ